MHAAALLNPWQQRFPLLAEPFAAIGAQTGQTADEVLAAFAAAQRCGALSRIAGIFGAGAGGAGLLVAMAVPGEALDAVAARVSAEPLVNHNYEREHALNLWFVVNAGDAAAVEAVVARIEHTTGLPAVRLPLLRPYRIDLGFDLGARTATVAMAPQRPAPAVPAAERALAALVEQGLPLLPRPYDAWAQALGREPGALLAQLAGWLDDGTLKRFGTIVRHHELGFAANAMTVFELPEAEVDAHGEALARVPGVTLAYRRAPAAGWPFNLYCMVHGRDREAVHAVLARAVQAAALADFPRAVLFSRRRFKQTGASRFAAPSTEAADAIA
ncbi:AsnC family transcriptional regulator [Rubrivivax gelatinosus]|nr:AsnC family transcriptional regulator [Rubrivivax gelatinosus]